MSEKKDINMADADIIDDVSQKNVEKDEVHNTTEKEPVVVKKSGTGLSFLALLVALGVGGAGYYFGQQEVDKMNQKFTALSESVTQQLAPKAGISVTQPSATLPNNLESELTKITGVVENLQSTNEKVSALGVNLSDKEKTLESLKAEVQKLAGNVKSQPNDWLFSEADFLLGNALRKLVLDNDVDTSISLLKIADEVLAKISDPEAKTVRAAINNDLKQLLDLNRVDQNAVMQRLSQLANNVDELVALNVNFGDQSATENDKVSDDVTDWKSNLEKTATSFMNHFVRITPRSDNNAQALLAPNQDIYLRENIRLRLQIAILAVPRQQNELYKQSLETVAAWVRSYFDTNTEVAANFLKSVDELAEQSIYIDVPNQLTSLNALDKILNKQTQEIQKVEISADKGLTESNEAAEREIKAENNAEETKTEETKANEPQNSAPNDASQTDAQQ